MDVQQSDEHTTEHPPGWLRAVLQSYAAYGPRLTGQRQAIVQWIAAAPGPFTAEAAVAALCSPSGIGRATVYRTLDWLRGDGWVARTHCAPLEHAYVRQLPGQHYHALCTHCGSTIALNDGRIDALLASVLTGLDFEPRAQLVELYGLCGQCRTHP